MPDSKKKVINYPLRIPVDLHAKIKAAAKKDLRSMQGWLVVAAEEKLERDQREVA